MDKVNVVERSKPTFAAAMILKPRSRWSWPWGASWFIEKSVHECHHHLYASCLPSQNKNVVFFDSMQSLALLYPDEKNFIRHPAFSPTSTLSDAAHSDSEMFDNVPDLLLILPKGKFGYPKQGRSNTMAGTKKVDGLIEIALSGRISKNGRIGSIGVASVQPALVSDGKLFDASTIILSRPKSDSLNMYFGEWLKRCSFPLTRSMLA